MPSSRWDGKKRNNLITFSIKRKKKKIAVEQEDDQDIADEGQNLTETTTIFEPQIHRSTLSNRIKLVDPRFSRNYSCDQFRRERDDGKECVRGAC